MVTALCWTSDQSLWVGTDRGGLARIAPVAIVSYVPGAEHGLTAREREVLQLLVDGHSYKTAAQALDLALDTLRFHIRHVYRKLHVHSKSEAVMVALRRRIVD